MTITIAHKDSPVKYFGNIKCLNKMSGKVNGYLPKGFIPKEKVNEKFLGDCKWCNGTHKLLWCYNCNDWFCHKCLECHFHESYKERKKRMDFMWSDSGFLQLLKKQEGEK